jgi:5-methylcytosine-specific restriction endonuclease McrA
VAGSSIQNRRYREFRAALKAEWSAVNAPCALCGQATINWLGAANEADSFELDHKISRRRRPDLVLERSNAQPAHVRCNRGKGAGDAAPALGELSEVW